MTNQDSNFDKLFNTLLVDLSNDKPFKESVYRLYYNATNPSTHYNSQEVEKQKIVETDQYVKGNELAHVVKHFKSEIESLKKRIDTLENSKQVNIPSMAFPNIGSPFPNVGMAEAKDPFPANMEEEILKKVKELEDKVRTKDWNEGLE